MSRNLRILVAVAALVGVVLSCALLIWLPRAPLWLAQQRWQNRPFQTYRMVIDVTMYTQFCKLDVVVHNDEVITVHENWCDRQGLFYTDPLEARSIDEIFHDLSGSWHGVQCGVGSCRCGHPVYLVVHYDEELGFPTEWYRQRIDVEANPLPECAVDIGEGPVWKVSRLEPIR